MALPDRWIRPLAARSDARNLRRRVWAGGVAQRFAVATSSSYLSQSETNPVLAGLGGLPAADSIVVMWPDGGVSRTGSVVAGESVAISEEEGGS